MPMLVQLTRLLPIAAVAVLPAPASADARDGYSPAYERCITMGDAAKGITVAIMDCLAAEIERQDETLNTVYKAVMAGLDDAARKRLRDEERFWIARRAARCDDLADQGGGGSMAAITYSNCFLDETIARHRFLKTYTAAR